jgi:hypothetical protein
LAENACPGNPSVRNTKVKTTIMVILDIKKKGDVRAERERIGVIRGLGSDFKIEFSPSQPPQAPGFQNPQSLATMSVMVHPKAIDSVNDMPLYGAESA